MAALIQPVSDMFHMTSEDFKSSQYLNRSKVNYSNSRKASKLALELQGLWRMNQTPQGKVRESLLCRIFFEGGILGGPSGVEDQI